MFCVYDTSQTWSSTGTTTNSNTVTDQLTESCLLTGVLMQTRFLSTRLRLFTVAQN